MQKFKNGSLCLMIVLICITVFLPNTVTASGDGDTIIITREFISTDADSDKKSYKVTVDIYTESLVQSLKTHSATFEAFENLRTGLRRLEVTYDRERDMQRDFPDDETNFTLTFRDQDDYVFNYKPSGKPDDHVVILAPSHGDNTTLTPPFIWKEPADVEEGNKLLVKAGLESDFVTDIFEYPFPIQHTFESYSFTPDDDNSFFSIGLLDERIDDSGGLRIIKRDAYMNRVVFTPREEYQLKYVYEESRGSVIPAATYDIVTHIVSQADDIDGSGYYILNSQETAAKVDMESPGIIAQYNAAEVEWELYKEPEHNDTTLIDGQWYAFSEHELKWNEVQERDFRNQELIKTQKGKKVTVEEQDGYKFLGWFCSGTDEKLSADQMHKYQEKISAHTTIEARFSPILNTDIVKDKDGLIPKDIYKLTDSIIINEDGFRLKAVEGERLEAIIDADGMEEPAIIVNADNVSVKGLTLENYTDTAIQVNGNNVVIIDNVVDGIGADGEPGAGTVGVDITADAHGALVVGNEICANHHGFRVHSNAESVRINNNDIHNNYHGIKNAALTQNISVRHNIFDKNYLAVYTENLLYAQYNWWGHKSGPDSASSSESYEGDVDYKPWIADAFAMVDYDNPEKSLGGIKLTVETENYGFASLSEIIGGKQYAPPIEFLTDGVFFNLQVDNKENIESVELTIRHDGDSFEVPYYRNDNGWAEFPVWELDEDGYIIIDMDRDFIAAHFSSLDFAIDFDPPEQEIEEPDDDRSSREWYECFIATAAYGSPMAEEISSLRAFRDDYLMQTDIGNKSVDFYYSVSPGLAHIISENDSLRATVRKALNPFVRFCDSLNNNEK